MAKQKDNYLDYVPKHNSLFECRENKKGHVEVKVHNKGIFNRIAQLIARKPRYSYIELDDFGTFVWHSIDGVRSIYDIVPLARLAQNMAFCFRYIFPDCFAVCKL